VSWASDTAQSLFTAVDGEFRGDGIAVAVTAIDAAGPVFVASDDMPVDGRFEIGSVTKTMTATLLACLVGDGAVALGDPIGRWLDAGPNAGITVEQLATHTSGLPRLAPNQPVLRPNPYGKFTAERAEKGLRATTRAPGSPRVYSNFGYQLLGLVISRASGRAYQDLIAERLLAPLQMHCSSVGAAADGTRLSGHARGRPVRHWDHALPGPGGVETSIGDLARYLSACLVPPDGPLGAAIELCQVPRVPVDERRAGGLGWMIANSKLWHNGRTGGFAACVGLDRGAGHALGALVNARARSASVLTDALLRHLTGPTGRGPGSCS
jgi:serine-type D-Ala-D-Ala carboxypeptidase/endopeptidase